MKLLMFNTGEFWYRTYQKTIGSVDTEDREELVKEALVIFVNVEKDDEQRMDVVVRKAADNITWLAKKTGRTAIVLHSFAHLSESKSDIDFARDLFIQLRERLAGKGYAVTMTPFGYLNEFRIHVLGESLAKVWKTI
ncbi:MAG: threonyl-tRNA synthetase editing domain-containing protein [Methanoregula sp.]|jgi:hypothetical protein